MRVNFQFISNVSVDNKSGQEVYDLGIEISGSFNPVLLMRLIKEEVPEVNEAFNGLLEQLFEAMAMSAANSNTQQHSHSHSAGFDGASPTQPFAAEAATGDFDDDDLEGEEFELEELTEDDLEFTAGEDVVMIDDEEAVASDRDADYTSVNVGNDAGMMVVPTDLASAFASNDEDSDLQPVDDGNGGVTLQPKAKGEPQG